MICALVEIKKLRGEREISFDYNNTNRYRIVVDETDGSKTAYYFSAPVYNNKTRKIVDNMFYKENANIYSIGSNAKVNYSNIIKMQNGEGHCNIYMGCTDYVFSSNELRIRDGFLYPTTNGFMCKIKCDNRDGIVFDIEVDKPYMDVRTNDKYVALMIEKFRPFVTVSCIGTTDSGGNIIAPAKISYQKLSNCRYRCVVSSCSTFGKWIMFEINMYEEKLIQDTTVESANPEVNNSYGSTAFIGNTLEFGEQWLYCRPNFSRFSDIENKKIQKVIAHLPLYNNGVQLQAFRIPSRFCSFGSNWENKIAANDLICDSVIKNGMQEIDISDLFRNDFLYLTRSEGFVLKPCTKQNVFSAIATGDSCYAPQIYEINFI